MRQLTLSRLRPHGLLFGHLWGHVGLNTDLMVTAKLLGNLRLHHSSRPSLLRRLSCLALLGCLLVAIRAVIHVWTAVLRLHASISMMIAAFDVLLVHLLKLRNKFFLRVPMASLLSVVHFVQYLVHVSQLEIFDGREELPNALVHLLIQRLQVLRRRLLISLLCLSRWCGSLASVGRRPHLLLLVNIDHLRRSSLNLLSFLHTSFGRSARLRILLLDRRGLCGL